MDALRWLGEAGDPAELPDGGHLLPPACEHLVWVALMAHVKDQPVPAGVEHPVDGHGELHYPQVGGQMPSGPGYVPDQLLPELAAQLPGLLSPIPARMGPYEVVLSLLSKKSLTASWAAPQRLPSRFTRSWVR